MAFAPQQSNMCNRFLRKIYQDMFMTETIADKGTNAKDCWKNWSVDEAIQLMSCYNNSITALTFV